MSQSRRRFLTSMAGAAGSTVLSNAVPTPLAAFEKVAGSAYRPFSLRGWQIQVVEDRDYISRLTDRALAEAKRYGITHLEFNNFAFVLPGAYTSDPVAPCRNWVLCGLTFRDFPKLARHEVLHSGTASITRKQRQADFAYAKELFGRAKKAGLKVMAWHHLRRDLPDELAKEYPDAASGNLEFLAKWEEATLTEFFELLPEVDILVVTSMTETPGILALPDPSRRVEALSGVFGAMERACRNAGKTLAIRDWGAIGQNQEAGPVFQAAMERMPNDVCIHIKNVVLDFVTNAEVPHPNLTAYSNRPLIVEFDVYGEYFGRADIPYVDPQYFCGRLDGLYALQPLGVTARIAFECKRQGRRYATIFDSPNAANAVAFSRWAADAALNRPIALWLDFLKSSQRWQTYYWEWLASRYGAAAGPLLARIFSRTPQIVHGIFGGLWTGYWHPFSVLEHTSLPWPPIRLKQHGSLSWNPPPDITQVSKTGDNDFSWVVGWLPPGSPVELIGWSELVSHKQEGLRMARLCAEEIANEGQTVLAKPDLDDLTLLLRQLVTVCEGDVLTGKILAAVRGPQEIRRRSPALDSLASQAERVAVQARQSFGAFFFGEFPARMEAWAKWARDSASKPSA